MRNVGCITASIYNVAVVFVTAILARCSSRSACHTCSVGFNSGEAGGSGKRLILLNFLSRFVVCQAALSNRITACLLSGIFSKMCSKRVYEHCFCIHGWHYKAYCFISSRADSSKYIGIFKLLLACKTRSCPLLRPCAGNSSSLSYSSFILKPDINQLYPYWQHLNYFGLEVFLKASWASKSALGWIESDL